MKWGMWVGATWGISLGERSVWEGIERGQGQITQVLGQDVGFILQAVGVFGAGD